MGTVCVRLLPSHHDYDGGLRSEQINLLESARVFVGQFIDILEQVVFAVKWSIRAAQAASMASLGTMEQLFL